MSEAELRRWLAGRHDWQDDRWQDHCGDPCCGHSCCENNNMVDGNPRVAAARQALYDRPGIIM